MNGLSVVIPSRTVANLVPCVEAVRRSEPRARIIVVDDGLDFAAADARSQAHCWLCDMDPTLRVPGEKPFNFSRNVNLGIKAAGDLIYVTTIGGVPRSIMGRDGDDVVILNDDAILHTPGGFSSLQKVAQDHPEYGLVASTCNNVGNQNQWKQKTGLLRDEPRMVCFVAVLIPRRTLNQVGLLDERFVHYGCEDDDYCLRVRKAGLKIGIHDGCYVDHGSLHSSFRGAAGAGGNFLPNLKLFIEKWGVDNWGKSKHESQFGELFPA